MKRHRILLSSGNMKTAMLYISDDSIENITSALTKGGAIKLCTAEYNDKTQDPYENPETTIFISQKLLDVVIPELKEIEVKEVVPYEPVQKEIPMSANPPLTKA